MKLLEKISNFIGKFMAVIVLIVAALALFLPKSGLWIPTSSVNYLLMAVMFGMGLTLRLSDFALVFKRPKEIITGCIAQFTIMPLLAFLLCKLFSLEPALACGVVLVGTCPGGTSSNVITYLSKGDLALSVGMTSVNTLLSPVLTPALTYLLLRTSVQVDIFAIFLSIVKIVILPVGLGFLINKFFSKITSRMLSFLPLVSVMAICLIVSTVVSHNASKILSTAAIVFMVVILHNLLGYLLGFALGKILNLKTEKIKALSVEIGMQNSGLATSLALTSFPNLSMATVPGAVFSVWHNISGALLANIYSRWDDSIPQKRLPVITKKILSLIIIFGFILCTVISIAGAKSFSREFKAEYDSNILSIAEAARECLNGDDFQKYLETKAKDEKYDGISRILQDFVDKFDLNMLYVSSVKAPDYVHITYIYNPVKNGGKWTEFPLGYEEDYIESDYNTSAKKIYENKESIVRHTMKTRSGSHITAMVPVFDSDGKVVAVLGAQKNIQAYVDARFSFINYVVIIELLFGVAFIVLFGTYFNQQFIRPIVLVTKEADHFSSYGGEPSEKLLSVKNRDEIGTLAHTVHQMQIDVNKNMEELTRVTKEKERIGAELDLAAKIQGDMLPQGYPPFPERKDFDLFASMSPAKEVGGDLYDYLLLDDDNLMIVVGDVSGKGVGAALFMGKSKVLFDLYSLLRLSPAEIFNRANTHLCERNEAGLFVTCWLGIYTFSTKTLRFVNAGHCAPIVYKKADDTFSYLKTKPNFVLGGMEGVKYSEHTISLSKGDRIFVYTDGVTEATDKNNELFEEERLLRAIQKTRNLSALDTLKTIREEIDRFAGDTEQFDDITMLQLII